MRSLLLLSAVAAFILCAPAVYAADDQQRSQNGSPRNQGKPQSVARPQAQARPQSQRSNSQVQARPRVAPEGYSQNRTSHVSGAAPIGNATRVTAAHGQFSGRIGGAHTNIDIHIYQRNVNAQHRFQAGIYHAPQGYSYHRWSYGQNLPALYFGRNFWINDYISYGLMAPPSGYVWVRFGPDALLLSEYTGQIVQVDYGMFY